MGILDTFLKPFVKALRIPVESFIRIETADDEMTLAAADGSLVTIVRVDGARQIIGAEEYKKILTDSVVKIGAKFDRPGHAIQVYFSRNPDRIKDEIRTLLRPCYVAARNIGLEIEDIFDERARHLSHYLAWEEIYFVLWTRPIVLSKSDFAREAQKARGRKWVRAADAQYPYAGVEGLRNRHKSFAGGTVTALREMGIQAFEMEVHEALRAIRANLSQQALDSDWKACLPGDKAMPRAPESKSDMSDILWPTLRQQLTHASARMVNDHVIEMGKYYWSGVDMTLGPMEAMPFPQLLARLSEYKIPFRVSYMLEGGGAQGMAMQSFLASIFSITNAANKQVEDSLDALKAMARNEPIAKMRVSFATWAPKGNLEQLEDRLSGLIQAIESWGYCQVSSVSGDPLDQVMSSAMGIHMGGTAPPAILPLYEAMKLMPWQRASSPFDKGAILFRTPDGRVWPYQTGTNVTTTWFDLVFAQPGGGKSVLMNTLNLGTCLTAGVSNLPFVAVIDIGPSSAGLISLIKDALPPNRRNEAVSFRLQMNNNYAINPFDTKLGMRYPQVTERSFLIELVTMLCTPPGQTVPYDGIAQLAGMVVDEIYRWRDDKIANAEPRPYLPRIDQAVDDAIRANDITIPPSAYWWDIVELLFDKGKTYEAGLAQRYAMPTLGDSVAAARRPQIRNLLEETSVGSSSEGVIHAFERMITSAVREFPILSTVTKFALNENRVCALDLADVCPQGDASSDRQTAIMYMLARHALVTPWWINEEALVQMPQKFRYYHETRLRDFAETPKRLCYDEFHRTSKTKSVRAQIVRDVREGRKRGIQIILASQMLDDFDSDMVDLATGVWILGGRDLGFRRRRHAKDLWPDRHRPCRDAPQPDGPESLRRAGAPCSGHRRRALRAAPDQHAGPDRALGLLDLGRGRRDPQPALRASWRRRRAPPARRELPGRLGPQRDQAPHRRLLRQGRGRQGQRGRRHRDDRGGADRLHQGQARRHHEGFEAAGAAPPRSSRRRLNFFQDDKNPRMIFYARVFFVKEGKNQATPSAPVLHENNVAARHGRQLEGEARQAAAQFFELGDIDLDDVKAAHAQFVARFGRVCWQQQGAVDHERGRRVLFRHRYEDLFVLEKYVVAGKIFADQDAVAAQVRGGSAEAQHVVLRHVDDLRFMAEFLQPGGELLRARVIGMVGQADVETVAETQHVRGVKARGRRDVFQEAAGAQLRGCGLLLALSWVIIREVADDGELVGHDRDVRDEAAVRKLRVGGQRRGCDAAGVQGLGEGRVLVERALEIHGAEAGEMPVAIFLPGLRTMARSMVSKFSRGRFSRRDIESVSPFGFITFGCMYYIK